MSHDRFHDLDAALRALEEAGHELQGRADRAAIDTKLMRRFEPHEQVVARLELSGPGRVRGGVDIRGDGSAVPFTGRLRRREVEVKRRDANAFRALRRALAG